MNDAQIAAYLRRGRQAFQLKTGKQRTPALAAGRLAPAGSRPERGASVDSTQVASNIRRYVANLSETCDPENPSAGSRHRPLQLITKVQAAPNNIDDGS